MAKVDEHRPRRLSGWLRRTLAWAAGVIVCLILVLGLLAIPLACTTTVRPPAVEGEGTQVLLVDYGRTPGLVLPAGDGGYDRWVYGDWNYYALRNNSLPRGMMALFLPTQGALGREHFDPPISLESIEGTVAPYAQSVHVITVSADQAAELQQRLSSLFQANRHSLTQRPRSPLEFVHHPSTYTYFNNSNHTTAGWLRELGCRTRGPSFSSKWEILDPDRVHE